MVKEMKFEQELEKLVDYVRQDAQSSDDGWSVVKYRDVPEITGVSSYYVRKLFEMLKDHPNIVFEIDKTAKTYKKPLKFRYADEEEKIESVVTEKSFYYLTQKEIDYVKDKLNLNSDYRRLYEVLSVCNYIASNNGKKEYIDITPSEISDILVESEREIEDILKMLTDYELLIDRFGRSRLILSADEFLEETETQKYPSKDYIREDVEPPTGKKEPIDRLLTQQIEETSIDTKNGIEPQDLYENMERFKRTMIGIQNDFAAYLDSTIALMSESEKKDDELNKGYKALEGFMEENHRLNEENKALKKENEKLVASLSASQKFRDLFIRKAEQRLEILLAEIIGIVSNYAQIPAWQKDPSTNARLQKSILDSVTAAVDDMLKIDAS